MGSLMEHTSMVIPQSQAWGQAKESPTAAASVGERGVPGSTQSIGVTASPELQELMGSGSLARSVRSEV